MESSISENVNKTNNNHNRNNILFGHGADVRHHHLVDERAEAEPKVAGEGTHLFGQLVAQLRQLLLVVLHRLGQVHQVVQIHGIVTGLLEGGVEVVRILWPHPQRNPLRSHLNRLGAEAIVVGAGQRLVGNIFELGRRRVDVTGLAAALLQIVERITSVEGEVARLRAPGALRTGANALAAV